MNKEKDACHSHGKVVHFVRYFTQPKKAASDSRDAIICIIVWSWILTLLWVVESAPLGCRICIDWVVESSSTNHIVCDREMFWEYHKILSEARKTFMGNSSAEDLIEIGICNLD